MPTHKIDRKETLIHHVMRTTEHGGSSSAMSFADLAKWTRAELDQLHEELHREAH